MFTFIRKIHKPVSFALALLLLASCNTTSSVVKDEQKPNVIYIMADDLTIQAISAYGGIYKDIAPTPNIDRLANEGMLFQDALCTNAICGPSRSCILTGKYAHVNGYYKNEYGGVFNPDQWTFPQEFKKNGYQTSLFGKWHLGTNPVGFDTFKYHNASAQQGLYWNPVYNVNGKDEKFKGYATNLSTDFAMNWLESERDQTKPFMMILQYKAPHRPWEPDTKYEKLWDDIEMPYPANFNDDYKGRELTAGDTEMTIEHFSRKDMKLEAPTDLKGKDKVKWNFYGAKNDEIVIPDGMSFEEARKWRFQTYIKDYLACVKSVDDNIGRVLKYLDENNLTENTVVVLTSDQGFYLGEHGFFDKRFIYEESIRMPLIVRYPKLVKPNTVSEDVVRNIDFASTLLDLAGISFSEKVQGTSFKPVLQSKTPKNWNQAAYYHYYEFPYWHHVQPHYGIRTQKFTLAHFYYNIDKWELYDLENDPMQMKNEIDNPKYASQIVELKKQLKQLMVASGNDKSLDEFRQITDKDFGTIVEKSEEDDINKLINGKK
jgi:arylsulfatase A-like enzyme